MSVAHNSGSAFCFRNEQTRSHLMLGIAVMVKSVRERISILSNGAAASPIPPNNSLCGLLSSKRLVAFAWDQCSLFTSLLVSEHIPVALRLEKFVDV